MIVYFVRHGQTILNRYNRLQGWLDSPLTERGINEAHKAGIMLCGIHFNAAYSSDTMRAWKTANIVLSENKFAIPQVKLASAFREEFYGYFEGSDSAQVMYMIGRAHGQSASLHETIDEYGMDASKDFIAAADQFSDAETSDDFWHRVMSGFEVIRAENGPDNNVLVVSHGTTIRSIVERFGQREGFSVSWGPRNGSVTKVLVDGDNVRVLEYGKL